MERSRGGGDRVLGKCPSHIVEHPFIKKHISNSEVLDIAWMLFSLKMLSDEFV
jgi:hypothetical protein